MSLLALATKSLLRRFGVAALLVVGLTIAAGLPLATRAVLVAFQNDLRARAAAAPFVLGAAGSTSDLVLHALGFRVASPGNITVAVWRALREETRDGQTLAGAVPLCIRATASGLPVVGTSGGYFDLRGLTLAAGGPLAQMGDCVLGSDAATALNLKPGDRLATDPVNLFSLAGGVPVRLRVMGVLNATGSADDAAVFVTLDTAWLIAGLGHSHAHPATIHADGIAPQPERGYIDVENITKLQFHFHGDRGRFPLTAVIVIPRDPAAELLLSARYLDRTGIQLVGSQQVLDRLLSVALRLRRLFDAVALVTGLGTLLLCAAVIALTVRLRRDELRTMARLGIARWRIVLLVAAEFLLIAAAAALLTLGLTWAAVLCAPALRALVL